MNNFIKLLLFHFLIIGNAYSQCDCSDLLKYGLYNHFSENREANNYSQVSNSISNLSNSIKSGSVGVGGTYKAFGANFNENQVSSLNKLVTKSNLTVEDGREIISSSASYIDKNMVNAYQSCLNLCDKSGLSFKSNLPNDGIERNISIEFKYSKMPHSTEMPKIKKIELGQESCYKCWGSLYDLSNIRPELQILKENEPYTLHCERLISAKPFILTGTSDIEVSSKDAFITIETTMGNYQIRIPPIFVSKVENFNSDRVGDVIASMMEAETFFDLYGRKNWMLANGDPVPNDSKYALYIGMNTPDLRGIFLRGKNYERDRSKGNPEGNLNLGEYKNDVVGNHRHKYPITTISGDRNRGLLMKSTENPLQILERETSENIGIETRPRNVTVNYFVKIN